MLAGTPNSSAAAYGLEVNHSIHIAYIVPTGGASCWIAREATQSGWPPATRWALADVEISGGADGL